MENDSQEFRTVAQFNERIQAQIVAARLNDAGIPAAVFGADSSYPCLNYAMPIEVKVNAIDYEEAMTLLAASDNAE